MKVVSSFNNLFSFLSQSKTKQQKRPSKNSNWLSLLSLCGYFVWKTITSHYPDEENEFEEWGRVLRGQLRGSVIIWHQWYVTPAALQSNTLFICKAKKAWITSFHLKVKTSEAALCIYKKLLKMQLYQNKIWKKCSSRLQYPCLLQGFRFLSKIKKMRQNFQVFAIPKTFLDQ